VKVQVETAVGSENTLLNPIEFDIPKRSWTLHSDIVEDLVRAMNLPTGSLFTEEEESKAPHLSRKASSL
jgi:hypothetical protein